MFNKSNKTDCSIPFGLAQAKALLVLNQLDNIYLAQSDQQKAAVSAFTKVHYRRHFPELDVDSSPQYVSDTLVLYSLNSHGEVCATASLMADNSAGFDEEATFASEVSHYREQQLRTLQIGRFVISERCESTSLKAYFNAFYRLAKTLNFDVIVGLIKQKDVAFHQKLLGVKVLNPDTTIDYGGKHRFAVGSWQLETLKPRFFQWLAPSQAQPSATQHSVEIYPPKQWDEYTQAFASVQTSFQRELQIASAQLLYGDVADFGCGSAKVAPFLAPRDDVNSYLGIDYSGEMLKVANWLLNQLQRPGFATCHSKIERFNGQTFDSAVSLNSYYSWPDPELVLKHIHQLLRPGGHLVLATPNPELNMYAMEQEVQKELLTHPHYQTFRRFNLELSENPQAKLVTMDQLIGQLRDIGFAIIQCHQDYYLGGLNFIYAVRH